MINIKVELGQDSYPIFIGEQILAKLGEALSLYDYAKKTVVVTDSNVEKLYARQLTQVLAEHIDLLDIITVPAGETSKSFVCLQKILTRMLELQCDRNVAVLAFGGGVIGDIAGFAASIFKRGVNYVQVPTTLLAQVDSSVGGKTGINHAMGKNLVGTFYQPKLVWSDLALLKTLPEKEIRCGLGEVIKYGIIYDVGLFEYVKANFAEILNLDISRIQHLVKRSCEIKAEVVSKDERESGLRMILNFGHTIGHAIEAALGYAKISHGEAVLLGMLAEGKIALERSMLSQKDHDQIVDIVSNFALFNKIKKLDSTQLLSYMKLDKKVVGGKLRFVLPTTIGRVEIIDDVDEPAILSSVNYLLGL